MSKDEELPQEDTQSEADRLRDSYRRSDGWHATNNAQLPSDCDMLFQSIKRMEERAQDQRATLEKVHKRLKNVRAEHDQASGVYYQTVRDLDILKLALAEAMEIPK
jgi:hypothetical protein